MERGFKDHFWTEVEKSGTETEVPFEQSSSSFGEATPRGYHVPFMDHKEGEGILIHL